MNPDDLKSAWQTQSVSAPLKVNARLLLNEVRRNERQFQSVLFWRDTREIGVALFLVPVWFAMGAKLDLPWTWYLCVPSLLWVAGFMWWDRRGQRRHRTNPDDTLLESVSHSLAEVEHQIWLLRNVQWWYLLPLIVPMFAFFAQLAWRDARDSWPLLLTLAGFPVLVTLGFGWVYDVNQRCVRNELEPRRRELESLLRSLTDSDAPDDSTTRT